MFGVDVGAVRRVQVNPGDHTCPVSVQMLLQTEYELYVPSDSQAYTSQIGVFGPAGLSIDSSHASGKPASDWSTIPSKMVREQTFQDVHDVLERLSKTCGAALGVMIQPSKK